MKKIRRQESVSDTKHELAGDVIWRIFERDSQSKSRFKAMDNLNVSVYSVRISEGFVKRPIKSKGRPISVMAQLTKVSWR